ncbi:MAG: recombinase family protein [Ramlibacter sp.]|nr:recombinase family protein [Ramlibacter sp.]
MSKKAAQYVRMSSDQQPLSIEVQKAAIAEYATTNGFEVVRTYVDEARSGVTLSGRSSMQQLLRDVLDEKCPFEAVLVLDVTRWGRFQDVDEAAYYEFHCRKNGVQVRYVSEPFRSESTPFDSILKQLKRAMAGEYSRELSVKVRAGHVNLINKGYATGALPCIGYRRESVSETGAAGRVLQPGERKPSAADRVRWILGPQKEVLLIRRIFRDFLQGVPLQRIADQLNADGCRTHDDRDFTRTKIRRLLGSEIVIGSFVWGAKSAEGTRKGRFGRYEPVRKEGMVPAIIDRTTWDAAQQKLKGYQHFRNHGMSPDELIERLRAVLAKNPTIRTKDFLVNGLSNPCTYLKHFGSVFNAYALAGRSHAAGEKALSRERSVAQKVRQKFIRDVFRMAHSLGIDVQLRSQSALILVNGVEVKVRGARPLPSVLGPRWYACHVHRVKADGRWLLMVRLNEDGLTGRDFFLLPPEAHKTFTGLLNESIARELEHYRHSNAIDLMRALSRVGETAAVNIRGASIQGEL